MFVLLYGTAVYNAPNAGSIRLEGQWYAYGVNLGHEYQEVEARIREAEMDAEWEARKLVKKKHSSFLERSPMISVHTQSLSGLAAPKI